MSVLVKGMDMPRHCGECGIDWCYIWRKLIRDETPIGTRPSDCPLVEVPPHGDLIDRDALYKAINDAREKDPLIADVYVDDYVIVSDWLRNAPTIIKKEKGKRCLQTDGIV